MRFSGHYSTCTQTEQLQIANIKLLFLQRYSKCGSSLQRDILYHTSRVPPRFVEGAGIWWAVLGGLPLRKCDVFN